MFLFGYLAVSLISFILITMLSNLEFSSKYYSLHSTYLVCNNVHIVNIVMMHTENKEVSQIVTNKIRRLQYGGETGCKWVSNTSKSFCGSCPISGILKTEQTKKYLIARGHWCR